MPQWIQYPEEQKIGISMDGKGGATDNRWIERFWKTLKYSHVYLNPADTGLELCEGIRDYIAYYPRRRHQTIGTCPEQAYRESRLNPSRMLSSCITVANHSLGPKIGKFYKLTDLFAT